MAAAVLAISNAFDSGLASGGLNLTTLTGGDAGGSGNIFTTRNGYQYADWNFRFNEGFKYACGQTIQLQVFADAGTAPTLSNNYSYTVSVSDPDYSNSTGSSGATQITSNFICKVINCASGADPGAINSGFRTATPLVCDQKLRSLYVINKVLGGQYTAKVTMANGEVSPKTFAVTDSVGGTPLWFRIDYRSVNPTTITFEVRRTIQNDGPGSYIYHSCCYIPVPVAAPIPRGFRNRIGYFAQSGQ